MIRYYCSGFDTKNAFGHGLGDMLKNELKETKRIVYIPGSPHIEEKMVKAEEEYVPLFTNHFKNIGIEFEESILIKSDMKPTEAQEYVANANFIMLMGGDPFKQKEMCENLGLLELLKNSNAVMLGYSAGAMLMSKYMIITPCSEKYPNFQIGEGLDLDNISIYPHNNTNLEEYPETLIVGKETYKKDDLIKVAQEYGDYYLLQDYTNDGIKFDISLIKSTDGNIEYYTENNGKIWLANNDGIKLLVPELSKIIKR